MGTVHYVPSQLFAINRLFGITNINTTLQNHTLRQLYPLTKHVLLLCAVFGNHYPLSTLRKTRYSQRSTVMQTVREISPYVLGFSTAVHIHITGTAEHYLPNFLNYLLYHNGNIPFIRTVTETARSRLYKSNPITGLDRP